MVTNRKMIMTRKIDLNNYRKGILKITFHKDLFFTI